MPGASYISFLFHLHKNYLRPLNYHPILYVRKWRSEAQQVDRIWTYDHLSQSTYSSHYTTLPQICQKGYFHNDKHLHGSLFQAVLSMINCFHIYNNLRRQILSSRTSSLIDKILRHRELKYFVQGPTTNLNPGIWLQSLYWYLLHSIAVSKAHAYTYLICLVCTHVFIIYIHNVTILSYEFYLLIVDCRVFSSLLVWFCYTTLPSWFLLLTAGVLYIQHNVINNSFFNLKKKKRTFLFNPGRN